MESETEHEVRVHLRLFLGLFKQQLRANSLKLLETGRVALVKAMGAMRVLSSWHSVLLRQRPSGKITFVSRASSTVFNKIFTMIYHNRIVIYIWKFVCCLSLWYTAYSTFVQRTTLLPSIVTVWGVHCTSVIFSDIAIWEQTLYIDDCVATCATDTKSLLVVLLLQSHDDANERMLILQNDESWLPDTSRTELSNLGQLPHSISQYTDLEENLLTTCNSRLSLKQPKTWTAEYWFKSLPEYQYNSLCRDKNSPWRCPFFSTCWSW